MPPGMRLEVALGSWLSRSMLRPTTPLGATSYTQFVAAEQPQAASLELSAEWTRVQWSVPAGLSFASQTTFNLRVSSPKPVGAKSVFPCVLSPSSHPRPCRLQGERAAGCVCLGGRGGAGRGRGKRGRQDRPISFFV